MLPKPKKSLGQHFLTDAHYIERIVKAIAPLPHDHMVEIGPGPGAITAPLAQSLDHLHVVELDRDLAARLEERFDADKLTVHRHDALEFDFGSLPAPLRVVGNLPYNVSTPLLFQVARFADRIQDCVFMLQKEVVDRMAASPSTPDYGRLSVMLQYRFAVRRLFIVPPGAFHPPPKVDSAIVRMVPLGEDRLRARSDQRFAEVVTAAFGQRRKTLRNTLRPWLAAEDFSALGIDSQLRAENLGVAEFVALADATLKTAMSVE
jgi:16S rRNA (adenine1518-N6/adenine1519-N6)-dimethyltransferase